MTITFSLLLLALSAHAEVRAIPLEEALTRSAATAQASFEAGTLTRNDLLLTQLSLSQAPNRCRARPGSARSSLQRRSSQVRAPR